MRSIQRPDDLVSEVNSSLCLISTHAQVLLEQQTGRKAQEELQVILVESERAALLLGLVAREVTPERGFWQGRPAEEQAGSGGIDPDTGCWG